MSFVFFLCDSKHFQKSPRQEKSVWFQNWHRKSGSRVPKCLKIPSSDLTSITCWTFLEVPSTGNSDAGLPLILTSLRTMSPWAASATIRPLFLVFPNRCLYKNRFPVLNLFKRGISSCMTDRLEKWSVSMNIWLHRSGYHPCYGLRVCTKLEWWRSYVFYLFSGDFLNSPPFLSQTGFWSRTNLQKTAKISLCERKI